MKVKCPHCGVVSNVPDPTSRATEATTVFCDVEAGGCDRMFLVRAWMEPRALIYKVSESFLQKGDAE